MTVTDVASFYGPYNTGPANGGAGPAGPIPMVITGTGFLTGATVDFGGVLATVVVVSSPTTIHCDLPAHVAGWVDVTVTNLDTTSATMVKAFLYLAQRPSGCGGDTDGQLGDQSLVDVSTPTVMSFLPADLADPLDIKAIAAGQLHSLMLKNDGTVWASGNNDWGQLGDGTTNSSWLPVQVMLSPGVPLAYVYAIAAGKQHSLAAVDDPILGLRVYAWGFNCYGQLGNADHGGGHYSATPVVVQGLDLYDRILKLTAGEYFSAAVTTALSTHPSAVFTWGHNANGQLGAGGYVDTDTAHAIAAFTAIDIAAGQNHMLAIGTAVSKTVYSWGANGNGQLGLGNTTEKTSPQSTGVTGVLAVAAGWSHSLLIDGAFQMFGTGSNSKGQLGDNTTIQRLSFTLSSMTNAVAIAGGVFHTVALKSDGTLWACGYNLQGQLCDGTNNDSHVPITSVLPAGFFVTEIAAGEYFTLMIRTAQPRIVSVAPPNGDTAGGDVITLTGFDFSQPLEFDFGGTPGTDLSWFDNNTATVKTPSHFPGVVDVTAITDGGPGVDAGGFTYTGLMPPPHIGSISPDHGSRLGGTPVTIAGSAFDTVGLVTVTFDGLPATDVVVDSQIQIRCKTPAHAIGAVDVVVTNSDAQFDTLVAGYTYEEVLAITGVSPTSGSIVGGTPVVITGTGFSLFGTTVQLGLNEATDVVVNSTTQIHCTTPPGVAGLTDVTVTGPSGIVTSASAFRYSCQHTIWEAGVVTVPSPGAPFGKFYIRQVGPAGVLAYEEYVWGGPALPRVDYAMEVQIIKTSPTSATIVFHVEWDSGGHQTVQFTHDVILGDGKVSDTIATRTGIGLFANQTGADFVDVGAFQL